MKTIPKKILFLLAMLAGINSVWARDVSAGRERSKPCQVCHGQMGLTGNPGAPHLAGQPMIYLVEQLNLFRSGKRDNAVMNVIAQRLTDQEISDLAAWYSSIEIELKNK